MHTLHSAKRNALFTCLVLAPLLQLIGDILWTNHNFLYSWSLWREASYIFFIPVGFLLAKVIARKSIYWAMTSCAFYVIGCLGAIAMMPLFRLGAFFPIQEYHQFPAIVQNVLGEKAFAVTLFIPGLFFPISLVLFGIAFLKYKRLKPLLGIGFLAAGILFWLGNAMEIDTLLIIGDIWLLALFCLAGLHMHKHASAKGTMTYKSSQHKSKRYAEVNVF